MKDFEVIDINLGVNLKIRKGQKIYFADPEVRDRVLFYVSDGVKYLKVPSEYLCCFDLEGINWSNVDVRGIDFSNSNASVNPRCVYDKSLEDSNFEGRDLSRYSFRGVMLKNTNLNNTGAHLYTGDKRHFDYNMTSGCYINGAMDAGYKLLKSKGSKKLEKRK